MTDDAQRMERIRALLQEMEGEDGSANLVVDVYVIAKLVDPVDAGRVYRLGWTGDLADRLGMLQYALVRTEAAARELR